MFTSTLLKATEAGVNELRRFFNGTFKISNKEGVNNLVTEADHAAEKAIISIISHDFPEHNILSEEAGDVLITGRQKGVESEYKWIIDPIDGTVNFASGIPLCCVSVGLEYNGKIILGAVYNPNMNEFFFAESGCGATLNDKKIHVSDKTEVITSCLVTG